MFVSKIYIFLIFFFGFTCLIIALVLFNYPSQFSQIWLLYIPHIHITLTNWSSKTKQLKQQGDFGAKGHFPRDTANISHLNLPSDNTLTIFIGY